jgi:hypothetical protein
MAKAIKLCCQNLTILNLYFPKKLHYRIASSLGPSKVAINRPKKIIGGDALSAS